MKTNYGTTGFSLKDAEFIFAKEWLSGFYSPFLCASNKLTTAFEELQEVTLFFRIFTD